MSGAAAHRRSASVLLGVGVVALEFAAAVSRFVASTLLPVIAGDIGARDQLALLVAGSSLGLFIALPVATRIVRTLGPGRSLNVGVVGDVGGLLVSVTAHQAWVFMVGQLTAGLASGLLAVFGVSAAIQNLDEELRTRIVALSSAMWIAPALIGPAATLGLEHLIGWRWTLLVPLPVLLLGRFLVLRVAREQPPESGSQPRLARTFLVPVGAAGIMFGDVWWPLAAVGAVLALVGVAAIMPPGTMRLVRGPPAALATMMLFAVGYFGADSLITVLLTDGYHASVAQAAIVLGAAPLVWGVTSLVVSHLVTNRTATRFPVVGLTVSALGVLSVAAGPVIAPVFALGLTGWAVAGFGVGLAYPALYIRSTTPDGSTLTATALATAVITAENFGGLLGRAGGGAISSLGTSIAFGAAYLAFTATLAAAVYTVTRTRAAAADHSASDDSDARYPNR